MIEHEFWKVEVPFGQLGARRPKSLLGITNEHCGKATQEDSTGCLNRLRIVTFQLHLAGSRRMSPSIAIETPIKAVGPAGLGLLRNPDRHKSVHMSESIVRFGRLVTGHVVFVFHSSSLYSTALSFGIFFSSKASISFFL